MFLSPGAVRVLNPMENSGQRGEPEWEGTFMKTSRIVRTGIIAASTIMASGLGAPSSWVPSSWAQSAAPRYEVDVTFPRPFPDRWVTGGFGGHCIDAQDHVLLLNRQDVLDGEMPGIWRR
jgi:hypothetical protein